MVGIFLGGGVGVKFQACVFFFGGGGLYYEVPLDLPRHVDCEYHPWAGQSIC